MGIHEASGTLLTDGAGAKAMSEIVQFGVWVTERVLTRVAMLSNSEPPAIAYATRIAL